MCAKNIQDPLNILQVNCGQGWRAAALRGRWTVCTFVTGRAGAGAGPLWFPAQGTASSCFSTLSRLDPAPLCTIGPPVLLVLTESTLHTIVDSTVGGLWKASQETGARRRPWRRSGSRVLRGLTCGCPDRLMRVEHSWEHWLATAPQSQGPAPVRAFAPFFTQAAVSACAAGSTLSSG